MIPFRTESVHFLVPMNSAAKFRYLHIAGTEKMMASPQN